MLKAQHLDAVAVEGRESLRADERVHAARPRPVKDRAEERVRHGLVIHAFEEGELRLFRFVIFVEGFVDARADASHILAVTDSEEKIRFGVLEEGMLLAVERQVRVHEKRRHPLRTVLVELVGKFNKTLDLFFVTGVHFFDGKHGGTPQRDLNPVYNKLGCVRWSKK